MNIIDEIKLEGGTCVDLCYQCNKCTAGCPVAYEMDLTPAQIIHAIRLGEFEIVLNSKTIWLCASCETCSTRCPQLVDIAGIMDACRIVAQRRKRNVKVPEIVNFYKAALNNMRFFGRLYEFGLVAALKLKNKEFTKDLDIGRKMFFKGKLKLFPKIPKTTREMKEIFKKSAEIEKRKK